MTGGHVIHQGGPPDHGPEDLFILCLLRPLRRVWKTAVAVCLGAVVAGGCLGYRMSTPVYECRATLAITPYKPTVFDAAGDAGKLGLYESFMTTQAVLIKSPRTLERILEQTRPADEPLSEVTLTASMIHAGLWIEHPGDALHLDVHFRGDDPALTKDVVDRVTAGYAELYEQVLGDQDRGRLDRLEKQKASLAVRRAGVSRAVERLAGEDGLDPLTRSQEIAARFLASLERDLLVEENKAAAARVAIEDARGEPGGAGAVVTQRGVLDDAQVDRYMSLLAQGQAQLGLMRGRLGQNHRAVVRQRAYVSELQRLIEQRQQQIASSDLAASGPDGMSGQIPWPQREHIARCRADQLAQAIDRQRGELRELDRRIAAARQVRERLNHAKKGLGQIDQQLAEIAGRIEQVRIESGFGASVQVISPGVMPAMPMKDGRKSMALFMGMLGGVLSVAGMLVCVRLDPRCRRPEVLSERLDACTGLGRIGGAGPLETASDIHRCRYELFRPLPAGKTPVIAVGSGSPDRGAGGLAMCLAISAAQSGRRVLLIDLDSSGRQATRHAEGMAAGPQVSSDALDALEQAEDAAASLSQQLGIPQRGQGTLDEQPAADTRRLADALSGSPLARVGVRACMPNLDWLGNDVVNTREENAVDPHRLASLVQEAREAYDSVILSLGDPRASILSASCLGLADEGVLHVHAQDRLKPIASWQDLPQAKPTRFVFDERNPKKASAECREVINSCTQRAAAPADRWAGPEASRRETQEEAPA